MLRNYNLLDYDWTPLNQNPCWNASVVHHGQANLEMHMLRIDVLVMLSQACCCELLGHGKCFADDLHKSRCCKCWESPVCDDPLRFSLCFLHDPFLPGGLLHVCQTPGQGIFLAGCCSLPTHMRWSRWSQQTMGGHISSRLLQPASTPGNTLDFHQFRDISPNWWETFVFSMFSIFIILGQMPGWKQASRAEMDFMDSGWRNQPNWNRCVFHFSICFKDYFGTNAGLETSFTRGNGFYGFWQEITSVSNVSNVFNVFHLSFF